MLAFTLRIFSIFTFLLYFFLSGTSVRKERDRIAIIFIALGVSLIPSFFALCAKDIIYSYIYHYLFILFVLIRLTGMCIVGLASEIIMSLWGGRKGGYRVSILIGRLVVFILIFILISFLFFCKHLWDLIGMIQYMNRHPVILTVSSRSGIVKYSISSFI